MFSPLVHNMKTVESVFGSLRMQSFGFGGGGRGWDGITPNRCAPYAYLLVRYEPAYAYWREVRISLSSVRYASCLLLFGC
jgi:hypothetical protein